MTGDAAGPCELFAANLALLRKRRGLSAAALGRLAGLSQPQVSSIEAGRRRPAMPTADRLARALGATLHEMITPPVSPSRCGARDLVEQARRALDDLERMI